MTPKQTLKSIRLIHLALLIGISLFFSIVYFVLVDNSNFIIDGQDDLYLIISISLFLSGLFIGKFIYTTIINKCKFKNVLYKKMKCFMTASIVKFALMEGPILITIVFYLLTANYYFMLLAMIYMLIFVILKPTAENAKLDLELSNEEFTELKN